MQKLRKRGLSPLWQFLPSGRIPPSSLVQERGFQAVQDYKEYDVRTHHTNMDTDERVAKDALKPAAVVMASVLYHAAMRDERIPRQ